MFQKLNLCLILLIFKRNNDSTRAQLSCIGKSGPGLDSTSPEISKSICITNKTWILAASHINRKYVILVAIYRCRNNISNIWSNAGEKLILNEKRFRNPHDLLWNCPMVARQLVKWLPIWRNKHTINTCIAAYYQWTNTHKHELSVVVKHIPSMNDQWVKVRKHIWNEKVKKHLVNYRLFSTSSVITITKRQMFFF